jgi:Domain of unknown function (DUF397)
MITADFSGAQWRKSSRSGDATNCVEVARGEQLVGVRDSKDTSGRHLVFSSAVWAGFLRRT